MALDQTLAGVARFLAGNFVDFCTLAVFDRNGKLERIGLAHADKEIEEVLREHVEDPVDPDGVVGDRAGRPHRNAAVPAARRRTRTRTNRGRRSARMRRRSATSDERSLICTPLKVRDEVVGAIAFVSWSRRFTPDDVVLADEIAQRIAVAVDNVTLYRRSEDARARLSLVASVGEQLALTLETQTVLDTLVDRVVPLFADAAVAAIVDDTTGMLERRAVRHRDPGHRGRVSRVDVR